ncbi:MerR family transcriptional regulator [Plantactinospora sp. KBS50]|uniref:DNA polymerase III subunit beta family protein n=1 Tax=Plantactinospora sp. KBS50 TaxID=2024580 RepID=UPI000BAAB487|nr:MerR family transcriptional regulator [Plantactinospora sp. KBS50]ASW56178.1 hypothetical protein CIK06_21465 [Plantactinospora sp. KBS50]
MHSIGELSRASGLSVSALRFYDGAGVLVPAVVDPHTGYRWYARRQLGPARLLAGLRRVGMPLPEIRTVLARWPDPDAVVPLLDAHLRRLQDGLADARLELSRVHALLIREENPMSTRCTVRASTLAAALDAVRFAVGTDPELPALSGVRLEETDDGLRLLATDRYRLAIATAPVLGRSGPPIRVTLPAALVDEVRDRLGGRTDGRLGGRTGDRTGGRSPAPEDETDDEVVVEVADAELSVTVAGHRATGGAVAGEWPDLTRVLRDASPGPHRRLAVDGTALRAAVRSGRALVREHDGVPREIVVLAPDPAGGVAVSDPHAPGPGETIALDREFLLQALDAGGPGQLVLELDNPVRPLAIRSATGPGYSVLMPVRL